MSASVLYMSMSLDGDIAGPNDEPGNPGGDDDAVGRLHAWIVTPDGAIGRPSGPAAQLVSAHKCRVKFTARHTSVGTSLRCCCSSMHELDDKRRELCAGFGC